MPVQTRWHATTYRCNAECNGCVAARDLPGPCAPAHAGHAACAAHAAPCTTDAVPCLHVAHVQVHQRVLCVLPVLAQQCPLLCRAHPCAGATHTLCLACLRQSFHAPSRLPGPWPPSAGKRARLSSRSHAVARATQRVSFAPGAGPAPLCKRLAREAEDNVVCALKPVK